MGINQLAEIDLQLILGQSVRAAVEMIRHPSNRTRINIDGLVALALQFEHSQMALVQFIEAELFG